MGVPGDCRDPAPNLYKQCATPIHQKRGETRVEQETGRSERSEQERTEEQ